VDKYWLQLHLTHEKNTRTRQLVRGERPAQIRIVRDENDHYTL
jgi:hypothetical protein